MRPLARSIAMASPVREGRTWSPPSRAWTVNVLNPSARGGPRQANQDPQATDETEGTSFCLGPSLLPHPHLRLNLKTTGTELVQAMRPRSRPTPAAPCRLTNSRLCAILPRPALPTAPNQSHRSRSRLHLGSFHDGYTTSATTLSTTSLRHRAHRNFATMASATSFYDFKVKDSKPPRRTHPLACMQQPIVHSPPQHTPTTAWSCLVLVTV